jgi:hypothetical protein
MGVIAFGLEKSRLGYFYCAAAVRRRGGDASEALANNCFLYKETGFDWAFHYGRRYYGSARALNNGKGHFLQRTSLMILSYRRPSLRPNYRCPAFYIMSVHSGSWDCVEDEEEEGGGVRR